MQYESECGTQDRTLYGDGSGKYNCHQDCFAAKTLYKTIDGTAPDTITAMMKFRIIDF